MMPANLEGFKKPSWEMLEWNKVSAQRHFVEVPSAVPMTQRRLFFMTREALEGPVQAWETTTQLEWPRMS